MEAELQCRESWAELCLHAEHCDAEGTISEIELGVALQVLEGELVFTTVLVNHNRVVRVFDILEGMGGSLKRGVSCKASSRPSLISVDVLASDTARNTSSSLNFRYDAYRNRNDRKPCVNGSYACRDFLFVIV